MKWKGQQERERCFPTSSLKRCQGSAFPGVGGVHSSCAEGIRIRMDVTILQHKGVTGGTTGPMLSEDHQGLPADPSVNI